MSLFWTCGDLYPCLGASLPVLNIFLRFISSATSADLLMGSMVAVKGQWDSSPATLVLLSIALNYSATGVSENCIRYRPYTQQKV